MRGCIIIKKILFLFSIVFLYGPVVLAQQDNEWRGIGIPNPCDNSKIAFYGPHDSYIVCEDGRFFNLDDSLDYSPPISAVSFDWKKFENGDTDKVVVAVGKQGKAAVTTNGGNTWNLVNTGTTNDLNEIQFGWNQLTKESYGYAIGDNSTVIVTKDGGNTWTGQSTPYQFDNFYDLFFYNNEIGWIVGSNGIAYHTTNSGSDWGYLEVNQSNPDYYGVYFVSPTQGWVCGANGYIGSTSNGGGSWIQQNSGTQEALLDIAFNLLDDDTVSGPPPDVRTILNSNKTGNKSSNSSRGIVVGNHGTVLQTADDGNTWTSINLGTTANLNDVAVDPDGYFWIVGDNGTIFTNRPENVVTIPVAPSGITATAVSGSQIDLNWTDNSNNETGFKIERKTGQSNFAELASLDSNTTEYSDNNLTDGTNYTYRISALNSAGNSSYSNEASEITPLNTPSNLSIKMLLNNSVQLEWNDNSQSETGFTIERKSGTNSYSKLRDVATDITTYEDAQIPGGNEYHYKVKAFNEIVASEYSNEVSAIISDVLSRDELPSEFSLHQNYPNPFNTATTIRYQIPVPGLVSLKIFDLLGRGIKTLVNEEKSPGYYEVKLDASELSTGVYLYKLKCGEFNHVKKFVLLK